MQLMPARFLRASRRVLEAPCQSKLGVREIAVFELINSCPGRHSVRVNVVTKTEHLNDVELRAGVTRAGP